MVPMSAGPLVRVLIERDELEAAEIELQASGMADGRVPASVAFDSFRLARGHLRFEQGRFEQAVEDLVTLSRQTESMQLGIGQAAVASPLTVRALLALGEREQAHQIAEDTLVVAKRWGARSMVAYALRALALTTGGMAGVKLLQDAVAALEGSPRRLDSAYALSELGAALRREKRRVEARGPLREGLELARRCGAARLAKRTHDELLATGEKVRRYTPIAIDSLTPSERRTAELAASGMTNRQIAQSLFVTVKTVEAHLSAAYDKLGIRSRQQLAPVLDGPASSATTLADAAPRTGP